MFHASSHQAVQYHRHTPSPLHQKVNNKQILYAFLYYMQTWMFNLLSTLTVILVFLQQLLFADVVQLYSVLLCHTCFFFSHLFWMFYAWWWEFAFALIMGMNVLLILGFVWFILTIQICSDFEKKRIECPTFI